MLLFERQFHILVTVFLLCYERAALQRKGYHVMTLEYQLTVMTPFLCYHTVGN